MDRPCRQSRIIPLLRELRPTLANSLAPSLPELQLAQQQIESHSNNALRNTNEGLLSPFTLEEEYSEHIQAEAAFFPDIDNMNIHSSVLQYQSHIDSIIKGLICICRCYVLFILEKNLKFTL